MKMELRNYFAILSLVLAWSEVGYSSIVPGHITEESHPMLASMFNVVDQIQNLQAQTGQVQSDTGSGQKTIVKAQSIVDTDPIRGNKDTLKHVGIPEVATLSMNNDRMFPSIGTNTFARPDVISTGNINSGKGAIEVLSKPVHTIPATKGGSQRETMTFAALSADMWCSLCKQRGNKECIVRYCSNDGTSSIISEVNLPPLLSNGHLSERAKPSSSIDSTLTDTIPVLDNNFGFGSQIDRHDLLRLTSVSVPSERNVIDMTGLTQPTEDPVRRPAKETTAPIWLMADSVLGRAHGSHGNALPHLMDSASLVPPPMAESLLPVDITREPLTPINFPATEITLTRHSENPDIAFVDGNFGNTILNENQQIEAAGKGKHESNPASSKHNINAQPLDIPTNIFLQMIRNDIPTFFKSLDKLQHTSFTNPSSTVNNNIGENVITPTPIIPVARDVFAKGKPVNTFGFPNGFVEDVETHHQNDITTTTRIPHIPRAIDVFPIVRSDKKADNHPQLVIKDHGHSEKVALHVGHGTIPGNGISLLETRGQSPKTSLPEAPSLDLHSLLHSSNDHHSQPSLDVKTTTEHTQHALDHKHLNTEDVGPSGNHHQHTQVVDSNAMNHRDISEHTGQNANQQHSQITGANEMHPASALHHDIIALADIRVIGGLTEEFTTTTPIPTMDPARKADLDKFSEHLLSGIHL